MIGSPGGDEWRWVSLALLGAWHGLNPGMGWLFAVALGLQRRSRLAVVQSLGPIALGHALAIATAVAALELLGWAMPVAAMRVGAAAALIGFGLWRLRRVRHPTWVGMQVNAFDLTRWSWLMATAHGAGLMLAPVLLGLHPVACWPEVRGVPARGTDLLTAAAVTGVHTAAHLLASAVLALLVYERLGVAVLRHAWINLDLIWSVSLLAAGGFLLVGGLTGSGNLLARP